MGPKFNDPLYLQGDGLEVCGPTNFGPNDISLELVKVTVIDKNGVKRHTDDGLSVFFTAGEMWEADIDDARGLALGPAKGVGQGRVTRRNGNVHDIEWADHFELVDTTTFLDTPAGD